jgi:acetyl esterase/lipase
MSTVASPPPFDPEIARVLESDPLVVTTLEPADIAPLRARSIRPADALAPLAGDFEISTHAIGGTDSAPTVVLLRPRDVDEPAPVLLWVHGGGLVVGTAYDDLGSAAHLARESGCAVASVEYRLAPEHPYPAALDDVYASLTWLAENAEALRIDGERIIVAGVSAGGGLAAATALVARDRGGPTLAGQMLLCPMLDDRSDSSSAHQMEGLGAWDRTANRTAWAAYLAGTSHPAPAYAAPARAHDVTGLAPAFIDVGSAETFRDEDVDYARRIWAQGGVAELHVWPGGPHGFDALAPYARLSADAVAARVRWLNRILSPTHRTSPTDAALRIP